ASVMMTSGHYWMDPHLAWITHYMYSNHKPGNSGTWHYLTINVNTNNCPLATADPQNDPACGPRSEDDQIYRIIHEFGHTLGLGHGGRQGAKDFNRQGDVVVYDGGWNNTNFKPNYLSIMNYGYSGVECYNPSIGQWMVVRDYSDTDYGGLSEGLLSEQPSSFFATTVRAVPCPGAPAYERVFEYSCIDTLGTQWQISSDGQRMLRRIRAGSDWQTSGLPSLPAGIDWNCNGSINAGLVSGNING